MVNTKDNTHPLVDGMYSFRDLVDLDRLGEMLERFSQATGFTTGLISYPDQELLLSTGWRDICTKFHRACPASAIHCKHSNMALTSRLTAQKELSIRHCENGLVDGCTPIIIEGVHQASLCSGQTLFGEPDRERFKKQAIEYGYDVDAYLAALDETPVVTEEQFRKAMLFLGGMAEMLAEQGLRELRLQKTEEELRRSRAHLTTLVKTLPDMVWLKDPNGVFLACNPRFERFFGAKEPEILGKTDYDFVDKELADTFRANDKKAMAAGKACVNEEEVTFADDGHQESLETIKTPMVDSKGELIGVLGIARDITERKKAEKALADGNRNLEKLVATRTRALTRKARALEKANQRLVSLDNMKSAFLSSVSHELRTPLTSILGFAKLVDKGFMKHFMPLAKEDKALLKHGDRMHQNLDVIVHEGARLTRIVNDVLDLNKIESGHMEWQEALISPSVFIDEAACVAHGMFSGPDVDFVVEAGQDLPLVLADKDKLIQVMINLLSNAAKFTETGKVRLSAAVEESMITISVADSGKGIPPDDLERIFYKFQQVSGESSEDISQGTGLGLAISRHIVHHHNGRIWAESELGQGSVFRFTLPLAETV